MAPPIRFLPACNDLVAWFAPAFQEPPSLLQRCRAKNWAICVPVAGICPVRWQG